MEGTWKRTQEREAAGSGQSTFWNRKVFWWFHQNSQEKHGGWGEWGVNSRESSWSLGWLAKNREGGREEECNGDGNWVLPEKGEGWDPSKAETGWETRHPSSIKILLRWKWDPRHQPYPSLLLLLLLLSPQLARFPFSAPIWVVSKFYPPQQILLSYVSPHLMWIPLGRLLSHFPSLLSTLNLSPSNTQSYQTVSTPPFSVCLEHNTIWGSSQKTAILSHPYDGWR